MIEVQGSKALEAAATLSQAEGQKNFRDYILFIHINNYIPERFVFGIFPQRGLICKWVVEILQMACWQQGFVFIYWIFLQREGRRDRLAFRC